MAEIPPVATRRLPKKKALLIGIRDISKKRTGRKLKGPHNDAKAIYDLLIDRYYYISDEITMLLDDDNLDNTQPTKYNILQAIKDLVKGAETGDRFFFYFAGHACQKDTKNPEEEDGKDEHILTCDGKWIKDDVLNKRLVKPIPLGCSLRAVIDACHSGSLLDLEHCVCNRVYVPWVSKGGKRKMRTLWYRTAKQNAILTPIPRSSNATFFSSNQLIANALTSSVGLQPSAVESTRISYPKACRLNILTGATIDPISTRILLTQSPTDEICSPEPRFCDGIHCSQGATPEFLLECADVLCLSSSRDEQSTWEDEIGGSMTPKLVKLLRVNPNPTLHRMMTDISHEIHNFYVDLHPDARKFMKEYAMRQQQKAAQQVANMGSSSSVEQSSAGHANFRNPIQSFSLELVNFQDPELSSHFPIQDMHTRLWDM